MITIKNIGAISLCLLMIFMLIFKSTDAVAGAKEGTILCLYTVLPALFPYCVLSTIFQNYISGKRIKCTQFLERIFLMPKGCGTIFILGLLGGYPMGALYADKTLSKNDAKYMRAICNNAGPAFIMGITAIYFSSIKYAYNLMLLQALSALASCVILSNSHSRKTFTQKSKPISFKDAITHAAKCMVNICATIVLFRTFLTVFKSIIPTAIPEQIWTLLSGLLELTNGITALSNITNEGLRFIIAASLLSFGGLCVAMQTITLSAPGADKFYLIGKTIQGLIATMLAFIYIKFNSLTILLLLYIIFIIFIRFIRTLPNIRRSSRRYTYAFQKETSPFM